MTLIFISAVNGGDDLHFPGCPQVTSHVSVYLCILGAIDGYGFAQG